MSIDEKERKTPFFELFLEFFLVTASPKTSVSVDLPTVESHTVVTAAL